MQGICKWYNEAKGYGFIRDIKSGEEIFVHKTDMLEADIDMLATGDQVMYDIGTAPNTKTKAINLKMVD